MTAVRPEPVLVANLVATAFMAGVIWFVQVVHYPLMSGWPHDEFGTWEARHRDLTGLVVVPAMLAEAAAAAWLVARRPAGVPAWLPWTAGLLLAGIAASTFLLQIPCHDRLGAGWSAAAHDRLVATNWLRTILWTLRLGLLVGAAMAGRPAGESALRT